MTDNANPTRAQDEAAEWFARLRGQSVSAQALTDFREWRRDATNAAAYAQVQETWEKVGQLADDPDIQAAIAEALDAPTPKREPLPPARVIWTGLGALLLVVLLSSSWLWWQQRPTWETVVGEQRRVVLADGSRVQLNTDSAVRVRYSGAERGVTLVRGEALFEVAHDAARPFIVSAGDARIEALGTRFDVRRDAGGVRVSLLEGRVQVGTAAQSQAAILRPDQAVTVQGGRVSAPSTTTAEAAAGWTSGRITLRGVSLQQAVAEMNRYSRRRVIVDAPAETLREPVNGVFDAGDAEAFAEAVGATFSLQVTEQTPDRIRLSPEAASSEN